MIYVNQEHFPIGLKNFRTSEEHSIMTFEGPFDLVQEILKLKKDFDQKFCKNEISSSSESLKNFKFMAILGQGAFGVVVI